MYMYYTAWYPTIFYKDIKPIESVNKTLSLDISDEGVEYNLQLTLKENQDIHIKSTLYGTPDYSFEVTLEKICICRNGFMQYKFDTSSIPSKFFNEFKIVLIKDVYHLAKNFYHQHEADSGKDGALRAIITETHIPLNTDDNQFLIEFLKVYTDVFVNYCKDISYLNGRVQAIEELISYIENDAEKEAGSKEYIACIKASKQCKDKILDISLTINKQCENALIEYTYCKTLWCSKYNKSFLHDIEPKDDIQDLFRKYALNIRNSIRYIENIKYKNQNRINQNFRSILDVVNHSTEQINTVLQENKLSEKRNNLLTYLSLFFAIIFGLATFFTNCVVAKYVWITILILGALFFTYKFCCLRKKSNVEMSSTINMC